jgi:ABC-type lipoprotein export system ATPase subunit
MESQSFLSDFEHEKTDIRRTFTLKAVFDHLKLTGAKKMMKVIIHGESGSGKTALLDTLRLHTCAHGGFFVAENYFQNAEIQEPYSAIMAAFSDLCDLVVQSVDFTEERRIKIQKKIGWESGCILQTAISNAYLSLFNAEDLAAKQSSSH